MNLGLIKRPASPTRRLPYSPACLALFVHNNNEFPKFCFLVALVLGSNLKTVQNFSHRLLELSPDWSVLHLFVHKS